MINNILVNVQELYRKKSGKAAMEARLEGDKALKTGDFKKAVMLYSQSIIKAPQKSM